MEKWAFATSSPPFGLGLSSREFWFLALDEYDAKVRCWENYQEVQGIMYANLRADLHNGQMEKRDKRPWTPQDFGAPEEKRRDPRRKFTPEEILPKIRFAMEGKMVDTKGNKISALKNLKGQPLPPRKRA